MPLAFVAAVSGFLLFAPRADAFIYWSNWVNPAVTPATISRANNNGTGQKFDFLSLTAGSQPSGLSINSSRIYWAQQGPSAMSADSVGRANLTGTGVDETFISMPAGSIETTGAGTAVNSTHIYYTQPETNQIGRANLGGTSPDDDFIMTPIANNPIGIALNSTDIWWANNALGGSAARLARQSLADADDGSTINVGTDPWGIALTSTHIYWTNQITNTIGRVELDGGNPQPSWITGAQGPGDIAVHAGKLYWTEPQRPSIGRADLGDPNPDVDHTFIDGPNVNFPYGIAVDSFAFPSCTNASISTDIGQPVAATLQCTTGGTARTFSLRSQPQHGSLLVNTSTGDLTYTPDDGFFGTDSFDFRASNKFGTSNTATANVTVNPNSNEFSIGKAKRNKKKGTAKLPVDVPGAGSLELEGKKVKPASADAEGAGEVILPVKAKGKAKKKLKKKGKANVTVDVTFSPEGGDPATQSDKVKLKRKR